MKAIIKTVQLQVHLPFIGVCTFSGSNLDLCNPRLYFNNTSNLQSSLCLPTIVQGWFLLFPFNRWKTKTESDTQGTSQRGKFIWDFKVEGRHAKLFLHLPITTADSSPDNNIDTLHVPLTKDLCFGGSWDTSTMDNKKDSPIVFFLTSFLHLHSSTLMFLLHFPL